MNSEQAALFCEQMSLSPNLIHCPMLDVDSLSAAPFLTSTLTLTPVAQVFIGVDIYVLLLFLFFSSAPLSQYILYHIVRLIS